MLRVASALNPTALVYHCVDNLRALPGIDGDAFERAEDKLLAHCDRVFTTSPALRDRCAAIAPNRTEYFGNVADIEHFSKARHSGPIPADLGSIPSPRLGYMGVLSDFKIDLELVQQIVIARADWNFIFIGNARAGQHSSILARLKTRSNVHFLGWKPYAELPAYLRGIDVALLPQRLNDYTRAMFPMKYFEYLAAGRSVVATRLPALAEFTSLHREADTSQAFIEEIERALTGPSTISVDDPILQSHSWEPRLDAMLDAIGSIR
jgi:glycosyltransferase involved in cell wall biosynthesis